MPCWYKRWARLRWVADCTGAGARLGCAWEWATCSVAIQSGNQQPKGGWGKQHDAFYSISMTVWELPLTMRMCTARTCVAAAAAPREWPHRHVPCPHQLHHAGSTGHGAVSHAGTQLCSAGRQRLPAGALWSAGPAAPCDSGACSAQACCCQGRGQAQQTQAGHQRPHAETGERGRLTPGRQ